MRRRFPAATTEALIVLSVLTVAFAGAIAGITIWLVNYDGSAEAAGEPPAATQPAETAPADGPATTETATTGGETAVTGGETGTTGATKTEAETGGDTAGDPVAGKAVFASAGCGSCHTLAAAGSTGTVGPNLDDAQPDFERVVQFVTDGAPPMPAFGRDGLLDEQQILDVAAYVAQSTAG